MLGVLGERCGFGSFGPIACKSTSRKDLPANKVPVLDGRILLGCSTVLVQKPTLFYVEKNLAISGVPLFVGECSDKLPRGT